MGTFMGGSTMAPPMGGSPSATSNGEFAQASMPEIQGQGAGASQSAAFLSGIAAGQQLMNNSQNQTKSNAMFGMDMMGRMGGAGAMMGMEDGGAVPDPNAADQGPPAPVDPATAAAADQGPPAPGAAPGAAPASSGIPSDPQAAYQAGVQVAQQNGGKPVTGETLHAAVTDIANAHHAATLPDAAGVPPAQGQLPPQQSPSEAGRPDSLTPQFYDNLQHKMLMAAAAAQLAGRDGAATYQSLNAMSNSYFQGQMMRNLSSAYVALMTPSDDKQAKAAAVTKALHNVYYYVPDGNKLNIKTGPDGMPQYQDPVYPYLTKDGKPTNVEGPDTTPNYVDVTADHLRLLGQALSDPTKMSDLLYSYRMRPINARMAMMEAQAKADTATGALLTGRGREQQGAAAMGRAATGAQRAPYQNAKDRAAATLDYARANASQYALRAAAGLKLDPASQKAVQATTAAVDARLRGPIKDVSAADVGDNMALQGAVGKTYRDNSKVAPDLQKLGGGDISKIHSWAAGIVSANPRGVAPETAADLATQVYRSANKTHKGADGKQAPDVMVDEQKGVIHLWNPQSNSWNNIPYNSGVGSAVGDGVNSAFTQLLSVAASGPGGSGASGIPAPGGNAGSDDNDDQG